MSTLLKRRVGYMAHDRVEWCFLKAYMRKIGFGPRRIQLMMMCNQSVTYSILLNGEPYVRVIPTRGIHKGYSLSHMY
jgi:hypothetical protein